MLCREREPCHPNDLVRVKTIIEDITDPYVSLKEPRPNKCNVKRIFSERTTVPHLPIFFRSIVEILRYSALPNDHRCFLDKIDQARLSQPPTAFVYMPGFVEDSRTQNKKSLSKHQRGAQLTETHYSLNGDYLRCRKQVTTLSMMNNTVT